MGQPDLRGTPSLLLKRSCIWNSFLVQQTRTLNPSTGTNSMVNHKITLLSADLWTGPAGNTDHHTALCNTTMQLESTCWVEGGSAEEDGHRWNLSWMLQITLFSKNPTHIQAGREREKNRICWTCPSISRNSKSGATKFRRSNWERKDDVQH